MYLRTVDSQSDFHFHSRFMDFQLHRREASHVAFHVSFLVWLKNEKQTNTFCASYETIFLLFHKWNVCAQYCCTKPTTASTSPPRISARTCNHRMGMGLYAVQRHLNSYGGKRKTYRGKYRGKYVPHMGFKKTHQKSNAIKWTGDKHNAKLS